MGDGAADRAAVAHLDVADVSERLGEDRESLRERRFQHLPVRRERADRDPAVPVADAAQLGEPADVDQPVRGSDAELEERQQGLAARDQLGAAGVLREQPQGVVKALGARVLECGGDHDCTSEACMARHTSGA